MRGDRKWKERLLFDYRWDVNTFRGSSGFIEDMVLGLLGIQRFVGGHCIVGPSGQKLFSYIFR